MSFFRSRTGGSLFRINNITGYLKYLSDEENKLEDDLDDDLDNDLGNGDNGNNGDNGSGGGSDGGTGGESGGGSDGDSDVETELLTNKMGVSYIIINVDENRNYNTMTTQFTLKREEFEE